MLTTNELRTSRFFVVFLAALVSMGPIAVDAYLPLMPAIAGYFKTDLAAVNLTMSTFLVGMAIGQFFGGSLSDQLGRKKVGLTGLVLFFISSVLIVQASSIQQVQLLRTLQAIGSGLASVICLAQVRDLYPKEEVMKRFANIMMIVLLTPLLAPILGASLSPLGWQSIFIMLSLWSLFILIAYLFYIPETHSEVSENFSIRELFAGYLRVIKHRVNGRLTAIRIILFSGFSSGVFMGFLINSASIYMGDFGLNEYEFAGVFGAHGLMLMIGNRAAVKLAQSKPPLVVLNLMNFLQIFAAISLVSVIYFEWQSMFTVLPLTLFVMGLNGGIMPTISAFFIGFFDKNAGAAASLNTTAVFFMGGIIGGASSVLSSVSLLPIFLVMAASTLFARVILVTIHAVEE